MQLHASSMFLAAARLSAQHERITDMHKRLIATNNQGKVKELQELLKDLNIELITPSQINLDLDVLEDGSTYAENAAKKALAFAQASNLISLADDSGLEVDALNGEPGLYSARYGTLPPFSASQKMGGAGGGSDAERRKYLLSKLQDTPRPWTARFHAAIAIAIPASHVTLPKGNRDDVSDSEGSLPLTSEILRSLLHSSLRVKNEEVYLANGICPGEIIPAERGTGGFGYDPIFLLPELGKTMAELSMDEKNRLSHRARAVMKARRILEKLLG